MKKIKTPSKRRRRLYPTISLLPSHQSIKNNIIFNNDKNDDELNKFKEKYNENLSDSINDINFLIENLLKRTDIKISTGNYHDNSEYNISYSDSNFSLKISINKNDININFENYKKSSNEFRLVY